MTDQRIQTIREGLRYLQRYSTFNTTPALAALDSLAADLAATREALGKLENATRIFDVMLNEPAAKGLMTATDYQTYLCGAWLGVTEASASARAALVRLNAPSSRPDTPAQEHADTVRRGLGADCRKTVWPADHRCVLCDGHAALDALLALLAEAQQEAGLILVALAEPCAECGHVDWRADDARIDSYRNALATAKSERDEAYRQAAQADEANVMMGDRCRDVEIALATAEVLADRRLEALRQASDCCSRPPGVCFDSALARLSAGKDDEAASEDPTAGLPADLVSALRDPSVIVPQDAALFELIAKWANAPSDTASAETPEGEGR